MANEDIDETPSGSDFRLRGKHYMDAASQAYGRGEHSKGDSLMLAARLCAGAAALGFISLGALYSIQ